jgi:hypothetical protein
VDDGKWGQAESDRRPRQPGHVLEVPLDRGHHIVDTERVQSIPGELVEKHGEPVWGIRDVWVHVGDMRDGEMLNMLKAL